MSGADIFGIVFVSLLGVALLGMAVIGIIVGLPDFYEALVKAADARAKGRAALADIRRRTALRASGDYVPRFFLWMEEKRPRDFARLVEDFDKDGGR